MILRFTAPLLSGLHPHQPAFTANTAVAERHKTVDCK
jgi:hypothetical protein